MKQQRKQRPAKHKPHYKRQDWRPLEDSTPPDPDCCEDRGRHQIDRHASSDFTSARLDWGATHRAGLDNSEQCRTDMPAPTAGAAQGKTPQEQPEWNVHASIMRALRSAS